MYERILVPLDGSSMSEEILPYAAGIARSGEARLELFRAAREGDFAEATDYIRSRASDLSAIAMPVIVGADAAAAILAEANRDPRALVAMTSHGRTGLLQVLLGSVAQRVVRTAGRPVLLYRPRGAIPASAPQAKGISVIVLALDGSELSDQMEPATAEMASWLGAELLVVQVLPAALRVPAGIAASDVLESSYVHLHARAMADTYGVRAEWEVLHGDPADAICDLVQGRSDVMLAMASHGRGRLGQALFGSVAAECLRRSGVPILTQASPASPPAL